MKGRVLIVDDEAVARRTLEAMLKLEGFEVSTAASGEAALRLLEEQDFEVMVLDLKMPGMSGQAVLRQVAQMGKDVRIIMLTGHGSMESAIEAVRYRAHDYLTKPVDPPVLIKSVEEAVQQVRERRQQKVLLAQLEETLRKLRTMLGEGQSLEEIGEYAVLRLPNGVIADLGRRLLRYGTLEVSLTPSEGRLFQVLLEHHGQVLSHQELVAQVHGYRAEPWEAAEVLRPLVSRLRRKLAAIPGGEHWVTNVRGRGYLLELRPVEG